MIIRIGTRASALALWQARHVLRRLSALAPHLSLELVPLSSPGDERLEDRLDRMESVGVFTSTLESALLEQRIDLAVHSLKDLPTQPTPGLMVAAIPERGSALDVLCARDRLTLHRLPAGARIGTSSPRRVAQLLALRPDLEIVPLRGNVPTRLSRIDTGEVDAAVLAGAGVERLGLAHRISQEFSIEQFLPAPGQGALAIQVRADDSRVQQEVRLLDHIPTRRAVKAERTLLHALQGGCSVPVGAFCIQEERSLILVGGVFDASGRGLRHRASGDDPAVLGTEMAAWLLARGADELLSRRLADPLVLEKRP
jgi:hydroxymethylbilane synthase